MANLPHKIRHQQFGMKLLVVVVLLGLIFTVWYLSQKTVPNIQQPQESTTANASSNATMTITK